MSGDAQGILRRQLHLLNELEGVAGEAADNAYLSGLFEHILDREAHDVISMRQNTQQRLTKVSQKSRRKQRQR